MLHYRLSIPSTIGHALLLRHCVAAFARIENYSDPFVRELELTVHEAFINAVRHGNGEDPSLPVIVCFESGHKGSSRYLEVSIRDSGPGFDPAPAIHRARSACGVTDTAGRGVFLMSHFTESLRIERVSGGCELVLRYIPS